MPDATIRQPGGWGVPHPPGQSYASVVDSDPAEPILAAEHALLDRAVRGDRARVEALLDPQFREIGQSGRLWHRDEMVEALTTDPGLPVADHGPVELDEVELTVLADDLRLLTYRLDLDVASSRRSSVWRLTPTGPRLVFHQGTTAT